MWKSGAIRPYFLPQPDLKLLWILNMETGTCDQGPRKTRRLFNGDAIVPDTGNIMIILLFVIVFDKQSYSFLVQPP